MIVLIYGHIVALSTFKPFCRRAYTTATTPTASNVDMHRFIVLPFPLNSRPVGSQPNAFEQNNDVPFAPVRTRACSRWATAFIHLEDGRIPRVATPGSGPQLKSAGNQCGLCHNATPARGSSLRFCAAAPETMPVGVTAKQQFVAKQTSLCEKSLTILLRLAV